MNENVTRLKYFEKPKGYNEVETALGGKTYQEWVITFVKRLGTRV
jgi:hypothetical protein